MVDLDELKRLLKAAHISRGSTPIRLTAMSVTVQECDALLALRNAAEELIRDARRWRALDAAMAERGHQWTTTTEQVAAMLKILKEPT